MLRPCIKCFLLITVALALAAVAYAESDQDNFDNASGPRLDYSTAYKTVSKVKTTGPSPTPAKVKPFSWPISGFEGISRYNPVSWGPDCSLPVPAKGQFLLGPKVFFANLRGEARRDMHFAGTPPAVVDFEENLGLKSSGNMIWSVDALYQFRPNMALRYSFSPMSMKATTNTRTGFTFGGLSIASGSQVRSKWDRYEHRAGLLLNLSHTPNSLTSFYADWLHIEDRLYVNYTGATANPVIWNDNKNLAVLGLEFSKCLRNYKGNTVALEGKAGVAFLNDNLGYEGEAGLTYLIPIKSGRFGFLKGGYKYSHLRKERDAEVFGTTMNGAFFKIGFLF
jgi:hypothetical protein